MRRGSALQVIRMIRPDPATVCVLLLAICFLIGGLVGDLYAKSCDDLSQDAFRQYLSDYCLWFEQTEAYVPIGRCILLYFSFVCVAWLSGSSPLGIVVVPGCTAWFGFLSFYTASCFVQAFGKNGVLLAASLTALRLLFTLPCYFFVASSAIMRSAYMLPLSGGRGKRVRSTADSRSHTFVFALCLLSLCVGIFCERLLTPILFRAVFDRFYSLFLS